MKYICLGYMEEKKWETMSESERNAMLDDCFAYDDALRKNGHFVGGEALQSPQNATALRWKNGAHHRWPVCRDERALRRNPRTRSQGPEPRHPVDVKSPRCEGRTLRDPPRCGFDRNDPRK